VRTVFLGTSDFAVTVLARLADGPHRPALVVTRPDRPRGRGRRLAPPPVAEAAHLFGLELIQPERLNDGEAVERIAATRPGVVVICAYGALVREPLLSAHPLLNVHPSLLPRWRGAAPIERAIDAGDTETGVCIMRPVAELDAGPVCLRRAEPIRAEDDFGSLSRRLAALAGDLLVDALDDEPACEEQGDEGVTFAAKIEAGDRRLDPTGPAAQLERRTRALSPHIGAVLEHTDGVRLGVWRAAVRDGEAHTGGGHGTDAGQGRALSAPGEVLGPPGELVELEGRLLLTCADGALELLEVQPPGGRRMAASAWLRGRPPGVRHAAVPAP
jgi:methionyl-tRNA formyltransferase